MAELDDNVTKSLPSSAVGQVADSKTVPFGTRRLDPTSFDIPRYRVGLTHVCVDNVVDQAMSEIWHF